MFKTIGKIRRMLRHWLNETYRRFRKKLPWKTKARHPRLCDSGEELAAKALQEIGVDILCRKMRNRYGEIDIIGREDGVLCFVEVKTRRNPVLYRPANAVDLTRQRRYVRAASLYRHEIAPNGNVPYRFDIMEIIFDGHALSEMNYIRHAFNEPWERNRRQWL